MRTRWLPVLLAACAATWGPEDAGGVATTFNTSALSPGDPADNEAAETAYLDAVAAGGYVAFSEGFTGEMWDATRSPFSAPSVVSKGITWHTSDGDSLVTVDDIGGYTPRLHLYADGGSPQEQLHAVPATLIGESDVTLYGIGAWVGGSPPFKGKLHVILDGTTVLKFERITGYENNDPEEPIKTTARLDSAKQFFGVVEPDGFTTFQLLEIEGVLEDQVLMWAADFTFARAAEPGDADKDGDGDDDDLSLLLANWGSDVTGEVDSGWGKGEFDKTPPVDDNDLSLLLANWTGSSDSAAIPEPATTGLLVVGAVLAFRRKLHS